ncbi:hypothetical protein E2562_028078 [Oryza meyeriana var. granulata]|uniref:Uncharacterized protein n=1 Tax=Oryza meyeriana var. granulata TaxID=110450 RepID=A0A6G1C0Z8_9ORYZ|nr:hypothetical protein E2562_028078 [Oryza meyeriana var. granulata]
MPPSRLPFTLAPLNPPPRRHNIVAADWTPPSHRHQIRPAAIVGPAPRSARSLTMTDPTENGKEGPATTSLRPHGSAGGEEGRAILPNFIPS